MVNDRNILIRYPITIKELRSTFVGTDYKQPVYQR